MDWLDQRKPLLGIMVYGCSKLGRKIFRGLRCIIGSSDLKADKGINYHVIFRMSTRMQGSKYLLQLNEEVKKSVFICNMPFHRSRKSHR